MISCLGWTFTGFGAATTDSKDSGAKGQTVYWYERGVKKYAWMATDEIAVFTGEGLKTPEGREVLQRVLHPQAQITDETDSVTILKSPEPIASNEISQKLRSFRSVGDVNQVSPVYLIFMGPIEQTDSLTDFIKYTPLSAFSCNIRARQIH